MMNNKRGLTPILIAGIVVLVLAVLYIILLLPFPTFISIRSVINYFAIIVLWIAIQVGVVYGIYEIIKRITKGYQHYKSKILNWDMKIKHYLTFG